MSKVTYWYHPESDCVWLHNPETDKPLEEGDGLSHEISETEYIKRRIEEIDNDPEHKLPDEVTAILKGAYQFPAGGFHGSIYYDSRKIFPDGEQVKISRVVERLPGGLVRTMNSTYLVEMIEPEGKEVV